MTDYNIKTIQEILNIDLNDPERVKIKNLNELPIHVIENARKLNDEMLAVWYINELVTEDNWSYLRGFVLGVVTNKENHKTWEKGVLLVLSTAKEDLLTKEREVLFNRPNSDFQYVLPLNFEAWRKNSSFGGAFAFKEPNANYKYSAPEGYVMLSPSSYTLIKIKSQQIDVQFRRWTASRIAGYLRFCDKLTPDGVSIIDDIVKREKWTSDALKALDGLLLELKDGIPENCIPGFAGPDDYYR